LPALSVKKKNCINLHVGLFVKLSEMFFLQFSRYLDICISKFGKHATLFGSEGVLVKKWRLSGG